MNREQRRRLIRVRLANYFERSGDKERQEFSAYLRGRAAPGVMDRADQVAEEIKQRAVIATARFLGHTKHGMPGPRLKARMDWIAAGILSGDLPMCEHITANNPIPVVINLWDEHAHCGCKGFPLADPIEDMTCDICRVYHLDDCRGHVVTVGPLAIAFGLCAECETTEIL